jgi:hypothetical protein
MMKQYKLGLRLWIGFSSILGFLGGWALLAQAGKLTYPQSPTSNISVATSTTSLPTETLNSILPTVSTIPTLQSSSGLVSPTKIVPIPSATPQATTQVPQFRSRGS